MIPPGTVTAAAAADGDVITRKVLTALQAVAGAPGLPGCLTAAPTTGNGVRRVPLGIARPSRATSAARAQMLAWLQQHSDQHADHDGEEALLHAVESSALVRPPAAERGARLDGELAAIYLMLARHWIRRSQRTGDHRYLNAALKLVAAGLYSPAPPPLAVAALAEAVDAVEHIGHEAVPASLPQPDRPLTPARAESAAGRPPVRIAVLAGAASSGLPLFHSAATAAGIELSTIVLHQPGPPAPHPGSVYDSAWYPRSAAPGPGLHGQPLPPALAPAVPRHSVGHQDWAAVAAVLCADRTDLLILLGMDVVPPAVLAVPALGTVNAHNGALPAYRGMDAVAWAFLTGTAPVCSVHLATDDVDAGDVLASQTVPAGGDLRRTVKSTQIALLTAVSRHVTATGRLPPAHPQSGTPRRYYRMHPALRRLLDARRPTALIGGTP
ncbi:formyltransferase family protein [Streptomyces sp. CA-111067]|uniref:formyltransferase family protein n=1 Tax=Streptomyces sp. CA-111067 TaxID=3240046 RepID=UPI003D9A036A